MNRKKRMFIAAFSLTVIMLGAFCGFAAVDLSTERYMPDRFGPFFVIYGISLTDANFAFMSKDYSIDFSPVRQVREVMTKYRGFMPQAPRIAAAGTAAAMAWYLNGGVSGSELSAGD